MFVENRCPLYFISSGCQVGPSFPRTTGEGVDGKNTRCRGEAFPGSAELHFGLFSGSSSFLPQGGSAYQPGAAPQETAPRPFAACRVAAYSLRTWPDAESYAEAVDASLLPKRQPVSLRSAQGMSNGIAIPRASLRCALGWYAAARSALKSLIIISCELGFAREL